MEDVFGIKPYGETFKIAVEKAAEGVGAFLAATCMPAAEEFGLIVKDKFRYWRLNNAVRMLEKAKGKFEFTDDKLQLKVNPRIGIEIIENASWQEDDNILEMWAGLLNSSLNIDGIDDSNIIFINLLKSLTSVQCRILQYICANGGIARDKNGLIHTKTACKISMNALFEIAQTNDIDRLDRELDHLRSLDLLPSSIFGGSGFTRNQKDFTQIALEPSALALNFYARVNGFKNNYDCFPNAEQK